MSRQFKLQQNTDAVDIDAKCLGISAWVDGDSQNLLNSNRGLHIQIRHNGNKETFDAATQLSRLISASPLMLEALEHVMAVIDNGYQDNVVFDVIGLRAAIRKARGES